MESNHTFSSTWEFSPRAQQELQKAVLEACAVNLEVPPGTKGPTATFILTCTEATFGIFLETIKEYITQTLAQQSEGNDDLFEIPLIQRVPGTAQALNEATGDLNGEEESEAGDDERLIDETEHSKVWQPSHGTGLEFVRAQQALLTAVAAFCEVSFNPTNISDGLLVIASDSEAIDLAIQKLGILEECINHSTVVHNFLIRGGITSPLMQFIPLEDYSGVTGKVLLGGVAPAKASRILLKASALVLVKDGHMRLRNDKNHRVTGKHLWKDHQLFISEVIAAAVSSTTQWVNSSSAEASSNPFRGDPPDASKAESKLPTTATPSRPLAKRTRVPRGEKMEALKNLESQKEAETNSRRETNNVKQAEQIDVIDDPRKSHEPPPIQPPFVLGQHQPKPHEMKSSAKLKTSNRKHPAMKAVNTNGVGPSDNPGDMKHRAMNQKKGQATESRSGLIMSFHKIITESIRSSICCSGCLRLHVNIGFMLFNASRIPEDLPRIFNAQEWRGFLDPFKSDDATRVFFTSSVSSSHEDASSILMLKTEKGKALVRAEPIRRTTKYIFVCESGSKEEVVIEIDATSKMILAIQGPLRPRICLNWSYLSWVWDACLELSAHAWLFGNYRHQAQQMAQSLQYVKEPEGLSLTTSTGDEYFRIRSARLKRETVHPSGLYPDLLLHLTEVQDLRVQRSPSRADRYQGNIKEVPVMIEEQRLWWEVSISSQKATNVFSTHENRELGGKTQWNSGKEIDAEILRDMFSMCEDIVEGIDHVGMDNNNPAVVAAGRSTNLGQSRRSGTSPSRSGAW